MKTTTNIISTYNTETGTTQHETTIELYTFNELTEEARARVVADYVEERANDPYFGQYFADTYEREIWDCVRNLEESITCACVRWQYNRWYSCDFDCEYKIKDFDWIAPDIAEVVKDDGYYASSDLCSAWNAHTRKLSALATMYDNLCDQVHKYPYAEWEYGRNGWGVPENRAYGEKLEDMRDNILNAWIEELEAAAEDVRNMIEYLLRGEWDYYTSEEYARMECEDEFTQGCEYRTRDNSGRVFYSDSRKWYTVDGKFCEQGNVSYECVSIVKAS